MKKVLAVIVSIFWIALIVGVPAVVLSGNLSQLIPAQVQEQLDALGLTEVLAQFNLGFGGQPEEPSEPAVVVETATPTVEEAPPPTPTEEPTPLPTPTPEPTPTPVVEPTSTPTSELPSEPLVTFPVGVRGQAETRTGPGLNFDSVGFVDAGATILIAAQDETGGWFQMENGNWIPVEALASIPPVPIALPTPTPAPAPETAVPVEVIPPPAPVTPVVVRVNADANLRSGPGATFERIGGANFGSEVTVTGKFATDNWYLLDSGAWIFGELLETLPQVPDVNADGTPVGSGTTPPATDPGTQPPATTGATPTANTLANLRDAPNTTTAAIVGTAQPGQALSLVGRNAAGDWLQLESGSWIFAELVNDAPANLPVVETTGTGNQGNVTTEPAQTDGGAATDTTADTTPGESTGESTGAEAGTATATAAVDANLRSGPGTNFDLVGSVTAGTTLNLIGRNAAGDWLKLDSGAWIFGELVNNPPADLPVATA